MLEIRFDLLQSVLSLKENIAKRYGTAVENMELIVQDQQGNNKGNLDEDNATLF